MAGLRGAPRATARLSPDVACRVVRESGRANAMTQLRPSGRARGRHAHLYGWLGGRWRSARGPAGGGWLLAPHLGCRSLLARLAGGGASPAPGASTATTSAACAAAFASASEAGPAALAAALSAAARGDLAAAEALQVRTAKGYDGGRTCTVQRGPPNDVTARVVRGRGVARISGRVERTERLGGLPLLRPCMPRGRVVGRERAMPRAMCSYRVRRGDPLSMAGLGAADADDESGIEVRQGAGE